MPVAHYNFRTFIEVVISSVQVRFTQEITVATRYNETFLLLSRFSLFAVGHTHGN